MSMISGGAVPPLRTSAVFIAGATLALISYLQSPPKLWRVSLAAVCAALAALTRSEGIFLPPLVGLILLGMLGATISLNFAGQGVQQRAAKGGAWWSFLLGVLFDNLTIMCKLTSKS